MDEYSICNQGDFYEIAQQLKAYGTVIFSYSPDQVTAYNVMLSTSWQRIGQLPWGGVPGGVIVGVLKHGTFWFENIQTVEWEYVGEKLELGMQDAQAIAELLRNVGLSYG